MLDIIAAIFATPLYATVVGILISLSPVRAVTKLVAFAAAAAWLGSSSPSPRLVDWRRALARYFEPSAERNFLAGVTVNVRF